MKLNIFFLKEPQSSVRVIASLCSIPPTTARTIMTEYLLLKLHKVQFFQQSYEEDLNNRTEICQTLLLMLQNKGIKENFFAMKPDII